MTDLFVFSTQELNAETMRRTMADTKRLLTLGILERAMVKRVWAVQNIKGGVT